MSSTSSCAEDKAEADSILNITGSPMTMTFGKKAFLHKQKKNSSDTILVDIINQICPEHTGT